MTRFLRYMQLSIAPIGVFLLLLVAWHVAVVTFDLPKILLPKPMDVAEAAWLQRVTIGRGMLVSGMAAMCAFFVCGALGLLIAVAFSLSTKVRNAFFPYVIFLQTVPIVAIAPLLIIWSGNNFRTIVLVATIIGLFPVVSNTTNSLIFVNPLQLNLFQVYAANRWQTLWKLRLPSAIPAWALGMKISSGLVVIGAIVGEFFVGTGGQYDGLAR